MKKIFCLLALAFIGAAQAHSQTETVIWEGTDGATDYIYNSNGDKSGGFESSGDSYYFNTGDWNYTMLLTADAFSTKGVTLAEGGQIVISINYYNSDGSSQLKIFGSNTSDDAAFYTNWNFKDDKYTIELTADYVSQISKSGLSVQGKYLNWNKITYIAPTDPYADVSDDIKPYLIDDNGDWLDFTKLAGEAKVETWDVATNGVSIAYDKFESLTQADAIRVIVAGTGYDAFACLKIKNDNDDALIQGSDKFTIKGWVYYDIPVGSDENGLKSALGGNALYIGGYNHTIKGVYAIRNAENAIEQWPAIDESTAVATATPEDGKVDASVLKNAGTLTANYIVRLKGTGSGAVKVVDPQDESISWIVNYDDGERYSRRAYLNDEGIYDFPLSDYLSKWEEDEKPATGAGMSGMINRLKDYGMKIVAENGTSITEVLLLYAPVASLVKGLALYEREFSTDYFKPVSLPYELSNATATDVFGEEIRRLDPTAKVKYSESDNTSHNKIVFYFKKIDDYADHDFHANCPYVIKVGSDKQPADGKTYRIPVTASVRDYFSYTFKSSEFEYVDYDNEAYSDGKAQQERIQNILSKTSDDGTLTNYMSFTSTAPVLNYYTDDSGNLETIGEVSDRMPMPLYSYYFYQGKIYPSLKDRNIVLGLAYVSLTDDLRKLNANSSDDDNTAKAVFDDEEESQSTGIRELETDRTSTGTAGIYDLQGRRVAADTSSLQRGIYIINGKKYLKP